MHIFSNDWGRRAFALFALLLSSFLTGCDEIKRINELPVAKGYTAKQLCSNVFNSGFDPVRVQWRFIAPDVSIFPLIWKTEIDYENKVVTVSDRIFLNENMKAKSIYREGIGCTALVDKTPDQLREETIVPLAPPFLSNDKPWPDGTQGVDSDLIADLNSERLEEAVSLGFSENRDKPKNTTSILIAYQGSMITERYALGAGAVSPLIGWSMTKSLTSCQR